MPRDLEFNIRINTTDLASQLQQVKQFIGNDLSNTVSGMTAPMINNLAYRSSYSQPSFQQFNQPTQIISGGSIIQSAMGSVAQVPGAMLSGGMVLASDIQQATNWLSRTNQFYNPVSQFNQQIGLTPQGFYSPSIISSAGAALGLTMPTNIQAREYSYLAAADVAERLATTGAGMISNLLGTAGEIGGGGAGSWLAGRSALALATRYGITGAGIPGMLARWGIGSLGGIVGGVAGGMAGAMALGTIADWGLGGIDEQNLINRISRETGFRWRPSGISNNPILGTGLSFGEEGELANIVRRVARQDVTMQFGDVAQMTAFGAETGLLRNVKQIAETEPILARMRDTIRDIKIIMNEPTTAGAQNWVGQLNAIGVNLENMRGAQFRADVFGAGAGMRASEMARAGMTTAESLRGTGISMEMGYNLGMQTTAQASYLARIGALTRQELAQVGGIENAGQIIARQQIGLLQTAPGNVLLAAIGGAGQVDMETLRRFGAGEIGIPEMQSIAANRLRTGRDIIGFIANKEKIQSQIGAEGQEMLYRGFGMNLMRQLGYTPDEETFKAIAKNTWGMGEAEAELMATSVFNPTDFEAVGRDARRREQMMAETRIRQERAIPARWERFKRTAQDFMGYTAIHEWTTKQQQRLSAYVTEKTDELLYGIERVPLPQISMERMLTEAITPEVRREELGNIFSRQIQEIRQSGTYISTEEEESRRREFIRVTGQMTPEELEDRFGKELTRNVTQSALKRGRQMARQEIEKSALAFGTTQRADISEEIRETTRENIRREEQRKALTVKSLAADMPGGERIGMVSPGFIMTSAGIKATTVGQHTTGPDITPAITTATQNLLSAQLEGVAGVFGTQPWQHDRPEVQNEFLSQYEVMQRQDLRERAQIPIETITNVKNAGDTLRYVPTEGFTTEKLTREAETKRKEIVSFIRSIGGKDEDLELFTSALRGNITAQDEIVMKYSSDMLIKVKDASPKLKGSAERYSQESSILQVRESADSAVKAFAGLRQDAMETLGTNLNLSPVEKRKLSQQQKLYGAILTRAPLTAEGRREITAKNILKFADIDLELIRTTDIERLDEDRFEQAVLQSRKLKEIQAGKGKLFDLIKELNLEGMGLAETATFSEVASKIATKTNIAFEGDPASQMTNVSGGAEYNQAKVAESLDKTAQTLDQLQQATSALFDKISKY